MLERLSAVDLELGDHVEVRKITLDSDSGDELQVHDKLFTRGTVRKLPGEEAEGETTFIWVQPEEGPPALVPTNDYMDTQIHLEEKTEDGWRTSHTATRCRMAVYALVAARS